MACEDASGQTPPFLAVGRGNVVSMKAFVGAGFDLNTRARFSYKVLNLAARNF